MEYTVSNGVITLTVSAFGAEMMSVKKGGTEYLWQGDSEYWSGRAYNLFPICGRLTDGKYIYCGKEYKMNLHGFAKDAEFLLKEKTENTLTFILSADESTKLIYPFDFDFEVKYSLLDNCVRIEYAIQNSDKCEKLYFTLGSHPGFNVPLGGEGDFEDWYIDFFENAKVNALVFDGAYMTDKTVPFELENGKFKLTRKLFEDDLFLTDMPKKVALKSRASDKSVTLYYPDMKYLGFWQPAFNDAPFLCIEPWRGVPAYSGIIDDFASKRDMIALDSGEVFTTHIDITLE